MKEVVADIKKECRNANNKTAKTEQVLHLLTAYFDEDPYTVIRSFEVCMNFNLVAVLNDTVSPLNMLMLAQENYCCTVAKFWRLQPTPFFELLVTSYKLNIHIHVFLI